MKLCLPSSPVAALGMCLLHIGAFGAESADKVIPHLDLKGATVQSSFDYLHTTTGLNIVLDVPEDDNTVVTLKLADVVAIAAARKIGKAARLAVVEEPHALVVASKHLQRPQIAITPALKKAEGIIVPAMELRAATLQEALDFLRAKARQLDPTGEGIPIAFDGPSDAEKRLTLSLNKIPLSDALYYVSFLAHLDLLAEADGLVLRSHRPSR